MPWDDRDRRDLTARKAASEAAATERHDGFDLSAQDNHSKFERPSFIPNAGTGDKLANALYRTNYDLIDWKDEGDNGLNTHADGPRDHRPEH